VYHTPDLICNVMDILDMIDDIIEDESRMAARAEGRGRE
jgi:hypothetical protein